MDKAKKPTKKESQAKEKVPRSKKQDMEEEEDEDLDTSQNGKPTLYDLLNVPKTATVIEIKKSYKALALQLHPDKNQDDPEATKNFQKLSEAYHILVDPEKRELYDKTGSVGDEDFEGFAQAYQYYRSMYPKIEKEDIDAFEKKYRFSDEETQDVVKYYVDNKGDVTLMLESIILSRNEDVERFVNLIEEKIKSKELKKYKNWDKTKNEIVLLPDESEEVQKQQEASFKELAQNILAKYHKPQANNFLDALEQKYGGGVKGGKGGKGKKSEYDLDDEEFEKIQASRAKNNNKKGKKSKNKEESEDEEEWESEEETIEA